MIGSPESISAEREKSKSAVLAELVKVLPSSLLELDKAKKLVDYLDKVSSSPLVIEEGDDEGARAKVILCVAGRALEVCLAPDYCKLLVPGTGIGRSIESIEGEQLRVNEVYSERNNERTGVVVEFCQGAGFDLIGFSLPIQLTKGVTSEPRVVTGKTWGKIFRALGAF